MADSSFDVVSKVDPMEAQNALHQAQKEIAQRYDFKNVGASLEESGDGVLMKASSEERVKAVLDVFEQKLIKRGISLRSLDAGDPFPSGKEYRIAAKYKQGIASDDAKKIFAITTAGQAHLTEREEEVEALMERLAQIGTMRSRSHGSPVRRAMGNLRQVLQHRLGDGEVSQETLHAVADLIDEAARKIERL